MAETIQEYLSELQKLESFWHFHSREYKDFIEGVGKLNTLMAEYENKPVDLSGITALRKQTGAALELADKYLARFEAQDQSQRDKRDVERMNIIKNFRQSLSVDQKGLSGYDVKSKQTAKEIISDARAVFLDVKGPLRTVGGAMSKRLVINVEGKDGFFTEPTKTLRQEDIVPAVRARNPDMADMVDFIARDETQLFSIYRAKTSRLELADVRKDLSNPYNPLGRMFWNNLANSNPKYRQFRTFNDNNAEQMLLLDGVVDLVRSNAMAHNEMGMNKTAGIAPGSPIEPRNVAMSVVADMIGMGELLARSTSAKIMKDGKPVEGVFMERAKGMERDRINDEAKTGTAGRVDTQNKEVIQSISDIQALDFLCGNVDRHARNMTYRLETDKNGAKKITGVTGIDNDLSFGTLDDKYHVGRMCPPDELPVMRRSTAEKILGLDPELLSHSLYTQLSPEERKAAQGRLKSLQAKIKKDLDRKWATESGVQDGYIRIMSDDDPAWDKLECRDLGSMHPESSFGVYNSSVVEGCKKVEKELVNSRRIPKPQKETLYPPKPLRRKRDEQLYLDLPPTKKQAPGERPITGATIFALYRNRRELHKNEVLAQDGAKAFDLMMRDQVLLAEDFTIKTGKNATVPAPVDFNSRIYRELGIRSTADLCYIDGMKARDYVKKYCQEELNERQLKAHIMAAATSGRHVVDVATIEADKNGDPSINLTELRLDLSPLNSFTSFKSTREERNSKLLRDPRQRVERFAKINGELTRAVKEQVATSVLAEGLKANSDEGTTLPNPAQLRASAHRLVTNVVAKDSILKNKDTSYFLNLLDKPEALKKLTLSCRKTITIQDELAKAQSTGKTKALPEAQKPKALPSPPSVN